MRKNQIRFRCKQHGIDSGSTWARLQSASLQLPSLGETFKSVHGGGGLVVSAFTFNSDDLSLRSTEVLTLSVKHCLKKSANIV